MFQMIVYVSGTLPSVVVEYTLEQKYNILLGWYLVGMKWYNFSTPLKFYMNLTTEFISLVSFFKPMTTLGYPAVQLPGSFVGV